MELVYAVAGGVVFLLLLQLLFSREKKPDNDPELASLAEFVDSTLQGYPDRVKHRRHGAHAWTCHTPLFEIQLHLDPQGNHYQLSVYFFRPLPFLFRIRHSAIHGQMKINSVRGAKTKKLISEKEILPLIQKLDFYDSVSIGATGMHGKKTFQTQEDLKEWHKALGSSIRFMRFLLACKERKESSASTSEALCPYCRGNVNETDPVVSCLNCRTLHHDDCWNETNRCSVFGCGSKSELLLTPLSAEREE